MNWSYNTGQDEVQAHKQGEKSPYSMGDSRGPHFVQRREYRNLPIASHTINVACRDSEDFRNEVIINLVRHPTSPTHAPQRQMQTEKREMLRWTKAYIPRMTAPAMKVQVVESLS